VTHLIKTRLRELREDREIKQTTLADYLNVTQPTYSDYENGKINIPIETLSKLADFYGTSVDYLIGRTNEREPYPGRKQGLHG